MTLFCGGRHKRHSRSKVSSVQYTLRDSDRVDNGKKFAIVLQSFEATVLDELSVSRGQVVEKLYTDSDWIYVRNVDGKCGYIPHTFCYGMDQVITGQQWSSDEGQRSSSQSPVMRARPKNLRVNTVATHQSGSQSSVEVHSTDAPPTTTTPQPANSSLSQSRPPPLRSSTPVPGGTAERMETPDSTPPLTRSNRRLSSLQPSAELVAMDITDSAAVEEPRYVEHPSGKGVAVERTVTDEQTNRSTASTRVVVRRSMSMNEGAQMSCRQRPPNVQRIDQIQRSISYQEAVLSAGEDHYVLVNDGRRTSATRWVHDDHMTMPPQRSSPLNPRRQQGQFTHSLVPDSNCEGQSADFDPSDDVFLPEPKKPVGIFRCIQTYRPKYKGELSVREGELVILLEYGRGDWAWVLTSMNQEGLIPRQYLVRYNPRLGVGGVGMGVASRRKHSSSNASTQTELVVDGGYIRHASGASSASAGATAYSGGSSSSVTTPQTTPPMTQRAKRPHHKKRSREKETSNGGEKCVASSAVQAVQSSPQWFENLDSLERRPRPTNLNCSIQTTPPLHHRRRPNNIATPQSVKSADCCLENRTPNPAVLLTPHPVKSADYAGSATAEAWFNSLSSTSSGVRSVSQAGTLTALRDYSPPPNAKNCLRLSKGDVLNAQPHMHYPKGWMWVWHQQQHSFGYVPQSHVGYTYAVNKGGRSRTNTIEDAV